MERRTQGGACDTRALYCPESLIRTQYLATLSTIWPAVWPMPRPRDLAATHAGPPADRTGEPAAQAVEVSEQRGDHTVRNTIDMRVLFDRLVASQGDPDG